VNPRHPAILPHPASLQRLATLPARILPKAAVPVRPQVRPLSRLHLHTPPTAALPTSPSHPSSRARLVPAMTASAMIRRTKALLIVKNAQRAKIQ
jgi:hypothetical protein